MLRRYGPAPLATSPVRQISASSPQTSRCGRRPRSLPVFAFGAPWFPLLEHGLKLAVVDRLGAGGRPYPAGVASRTVAVFQTDDGLTILAERHFGSAGPPSATELQLLKGETARWFR